MGTPDVPALGMVKRVQASIEEMVGNPTEKVVSSSGTVFYINDIARAIAKVRYIICLAISHSQISFRISPIPLLVSQWQNILKMAEMECRN